MLNWENYSQGQWSNGASLEAATKGESSEKLFLYGDICNSRWTNTVRPHIIAGPGKELLRKWRAREKMKRPNIRNCVPISSRYQSWSNKFESKKYESISQSVSQSMTLKRLDKDLAQAR